MCGRFTLTHPDQLTLRFDALLDTQGLTPNYNVAPTQQVPVVVEEAQGRRIRAMQWGFRPAWVQPTAQRPAPINARAETLRERPLFRRSLAHGRCLIPADGFYEWRQVAGSRSKQPFYIRRRDAALFAFAGLYTAGSDDTGNGPSCAIITTTPNAVMAPIHERMPAILAPADEGIWLDQELDDPDAALDRLRPYPAEQLIAFPVAALVSSPRNNGPDLIQPIPA